MIGLEEARKLISTELAYNIDILGKDYYDLYEPEAWNRVKGNKFKAWSLLDFYAVIKSSNGKKKVELLCENKPFIPVKDLVFFCPKIQSTAGLAYYEYNIFVICPRKLISKSKTVEYWDIHDYSTESSNIMLENNGINYEAEGSIKLLYPDSGSKNEIKKTLKSQGISEVRGIKVKLTAERADNKIYGNFAYEVMRWLCTKEDMSKCIVTQ